MRLERRPIGLREVRRFTEAHHRHARADRGWLFGVCVVDVDDDDRLVGVGVAGRPKAAQLDDSVTVEVTRVTVLEGYPNACSILYGALCRAGAALGYRSAVTYTLERESAVSVRAAGFVVDGVTEARDAWLVPGKMRYQENLFGEATRDPGPKVRWRRSL